MENQLRSPVTDRCAPQQRPWMAGDLVVRRPLVIERQALPVFPVIATEENIVLVEVSPRAVWHLTREEADRRLLRIDEE